MVNVRGKLTRFSVEASVPLIERLCEQRAISRIQQVPGATYSTREVTRPTDLVSFESSDATRSSRGSAPPAR